MKTLLQIIAFPFKVIQSLLFTFAVFISIIFYGIIFAPFVFLVSSKKASSYVQYYWTRTVLYSLKYICGVNWKLEGLENLPKDSGYIIAAKHESFWDTIVLYTILKNPTYVLKKQLLAIPFYGWYLAKVPHIAVDRSAGASALKKITKETKEFVDKGYPVVIFPQGTRTPIGATTEKYPYKPGIASMQAYAQCPIIPAALNSGYFWGKRKFFKRKGTITMKFLPAIPYDKAVKRTDLMQNLENIIESESKKLKI